VITVILLVSKSHHRVYIFICMKSDAHIMFIVCRRRLPWSSPQRVQPELQGLRTIPAIFHNKSNYDAHIIIKDIAHCAEGSIYIIPENTEK